MRHLDLRLRNALDRRAAPVHRKVRSTWTDSQAIGGNLRGCTSLRCVYTRVASGCYLSTARYMPERKLQPSRHTLRTRTPHHSPCTTACVHGHHSSNLRHRIMQGPAAPLQHLEYHERPYHRSVGSVHTPQTGQGTCTESTRYCRCMRRYRSSSCCNDAIGEGWQHRPWSHSSMNESLRDSVLP